MHGNKKKMKYENKWHFFALYLKCKNRQGIGIIILTISITRRNSKIQVNDVQIRDADPDPGNKFYFFQFLDGSIKSFQRRFPFFEQKKENVKKLVLTKKGTHAVKLIKFWSKVFFEITFKTIFFFHRYSIMRL